MEVGTSHSLPAPTDNIYKTPSISRSVLTREYEDMVSVPTPPFDLSNDPITKRKSKDLSNVALDENISPLDPRRFTPSLHANLVSEILSLRRDLANKTKSIDQLEQNLHAAQSQNDSLNKSLLTSNKEVRSVKRQMQLLEGGTLSAINDLSKERDDVLSECVDLRSRLEKSQKRAKGQEEKADRVQALWEKDKESWHAEKRALETKAHVVEGRLRLVLNEVAKTQTATAEMERRVSQSRASVSDSSVKRAQSELRDRRHSVTSNTSDQHGGRTSALSFTNANAASTSLADELALEDIDEADSGESDRDEGRISPDALPEERGRPASSLSIKARKILGLPFDIEDMEHGERATLIPDPSNVQEMSARIAQEGPMYVDAGVQYSWPETPVRSDASERELAEGFAENRDTSSASNLATSFDESLAEARFTSRPSMVSTSCQTTESLPSSPLAPKQNEKVLATILESAFERVETKEMSTQTNDASQPARRHQYTHSRTDTDDLDIPVIAIIPPKSRPMTPEFNFKLPPRTKNAGCQVEATVLTRYISSSMQTEEIRIDRRALLVPQSMPGISTQSQAGSVKSKNSSFSRTRSQPASNSAMKRSAPPVPTIIPISNLSQGNDNGTSTREPVKTKSQVQHQASEVFAKFDAQLEDPVEIDEDDVFDDDDVFNRPMAKFSLRAGKLVSQERSLEDIGELTARHAGEALALENLRQSEETLPAEYRGQVDSIAKGKGLKRSTTIRKGQSVSIRKAAIISNGTAAHQHKHRHSQSTITSSEGSGVPPPLPIPLRYSSARLGSTFSEGGRTSRGSSNASPTRQGRRVVKPALRKARSGPALSPAASASRHQRSRSPPLDGRISIVPDMPLFHMPDASYSTAPISLVNGRQEASAPRPSVATGPGRDGQHNKSNSDAYLIQQTSVVDAIAQTMVGEWMYKYVRRRKSFGKLDKDWDPNKSADELINNPGSAGVRHKRWVWVAPYERAIMWSSKQPMNGTALMGKSGRKLTIKSVLDVKDENPMPKNSLTGPPFNRSILILTPQRALKFTATSQERHYVWLTALSFLSHSPLSLGDLAALPPPPPEEQAVTNSPPPLSGSFRRRTLRDSIRIAKGTDRPTIEENSFIADGAPNNEFFTQRPKTQDTFDTNSDAAVAPIVKRYHTRKRSNTAPKAPPSAFRSFSFRDPPSSLPTSSYSHSVVTGSTERGPHTPSFGHPSIPSTRRGSEASVLGRPGANNLFNFDSNSSHNASMTMRMDAFIDSKPTAKGHSRDSKPLQGPRGNERKRMDPAHWSFDANGIPSLNPVEIISPVEENPRYSGNPPIGNTERDYFRNF